MKAIVHSFAPVTLVGGAPVGSADFAEALTIAPICVAADGGASTALVHGITPTAVIGDLDSLDDKARTQLPPDSLHKITEQNSTDFDKALRHIDAPVVIAIGFAGGRIDHQLAAFHTLLCRAEQACVILGETEIVFHCPSHIALPLQAGETVSLFPLTAVTGRSTGLEWPIEGLQFAPDVFVGTSNHATGAVELWMDGPGMLCILPRHHLRAVTQSLAQSVRPAPLVVRAE